MAENSYIKTGSNQHLGSLELNRYRSLLTSKYNTMLKYMISGYGIAGDTIKLIPGTKSWRYTLRAGIAIDADLNIINVPFDVVDAFDILTFQGGSQFVGTPYVYIEFVAPTNLNEEEGTISIDASGNLTGTGTKFTECLRGEPFHPMRIKFTNSTYNFQELYIDSVTSDTAATIKMIGGVTPESGLKYKVVGSFTPGVAVPNQYKDIYELEGKNWNLGVINPGVNFDAALLDRPNYQFGLAFAGPSPVDIRTQYLTLI